MFMNIPQATVLQPLTKISGFGLNESGDILLSGYGFNDSGGSTKLNHPVSISANYGKLAVTDRFNNRVLIWNSIPSQNCTGFSIGSGQFYNS
ncbi:MAG: hypothetical protein Ct9H90mP10_10440 [Actinomycetota bacterium]|nr:MAG: hypothetical protein Ct9H90mP10_10440 [Actinomycetota bacterium]